MAERSGWRQLRDRRMAEPGVAEAYAAARLAFELGGAVREMREQRDWPQRGTATTTSTSPRTPAATAASAVRGVVSGRFTEVAEEAEKSALVE